MHIVLQGTGMERRWTFRTTANGRYLYYTDEPRASRAARAKVFLTRVWDRHKAQEVSAMRDVVPVEPGPGTTTMILAYLRQSLAGPAGSKLLHDAATGKSWPLA